MKTRTNGKRHRIKGVTKKKTPNFLLPQRSKLVKRVLLYTADELALIDKRPATKTPKIKDFHEVAGYPREILKLANYRGGTQVARLPESCINEVVQV